MCAKPIVHPPSPKSEEESKEVVEIKPMVHPPSLVEVKDEVGKLTDQIDTLNINSSQPQNETDTGKEPEKDPEVGPIMGFFAC